ncbi:MAG: DUF3990 domain-containing protein [Fibromonadales bacterium]|nr:DUF3990 domain-containing protein [Fibromonadales bacterium]
MILFHGSNLEIDRVDLNVCKPYKDFGKGFYTTELEEQARNMAKRTVRLFGGNPCVTKFSLEDKELENCNIPKKTFYTPTDEWALFIINNRNKNFTDVASLECNLDNKYGIVSGPVANDDTRLLFDLFEDKIITIEELRKRLEYKELTNQISFHTDNAVKLLKKIGAYNL